MCDNQSEGDEFRTWIYIVLRLLEKEGSQGGRTRNLWRGKKRVRGNGVSEFKQREKFKKEGVVTNVKCSRKVKNLKSELCPLDVHCVSRYQPQGEQCQWRGQGRGIWKEL